MNKEKNIEKDFYKVKEVMEILQLSRLTIYRYIDKWELKTYQFWRQHRIKKEDFEGFLEKHKN